MRDFFVRLRSVAEIRAFVVLATTQPFEVYAQTASQTVSAKSFMGMFSLNYHDPVRIMAQCGAEDWTAFEEAASDFRLVLEPV